MALFGFGAKRPSPDSTARETVAGWVRQAGGFGPDVIVKLNEIVCADPACPGLETVILVMVPGRPTRALKVAKAMAQVRQDDVATALAGQA